MYRLATITVISVLYRMGEYTDHELSKDLHDLQASSTNAVTVSLLCS